MCPRSRCAWSDSSRTVLRPLGSPGQALRYDAEAVGTRPYASGSVLPQSAAPHPRRNPCPSPPTPGAAPRSSPRSAQPPAHPRHRLGRLGLRFARLRPRRHAQPLGGRAPPRRAPRQREGRPGPRRAAQPRRVPPRHPAPQRRHRRRRRRGRPRGPLGRRRRHRRRTRTTRRTTRTTTPRTRSRTCRRRRRVRRRRAPRPCSTSCAELPGYPHQHRPARSPMAGRCCVSAG